MEHVGQQPTKVFSELLPVHGGAGGQRIFLHSERVFCEIKMHNNKLYRIQTATCLSALHCMYSSHK